MYTVSIPALNKSKLEQTRIHSTKSCTFSKFKFATILGFCKLLLNSFGIVLNDFIDIRAGLGYLFDLRLLKNFFDGFRNRICQDVVDLCVRDLIGKVVHAATLDNRVVVSSRRTWSLNGFNFIKIMFVFKKSVYIEVIFVENNLVAELELFAVFI